MAVGLAAALVVQPSAQAGGAPSAVAPAVVPAAADADVVPPVLTSVSLEQHVVGAGSTAVLRYAATDVGSGVSSVRLEYRAADPRGAHRLVIGSPSGFGAAGIAAGAVPRQFPAGAAVLVDLRVTDAAGNSTVYDGAGVRTVPDGLPAPAALDLSALDLEVLPVLLNADTDAPVLDAVGIDTVGERHPGEAVDLTVAAADEGMFPAGVVSVRVVVTDPQGRTWSTLACGNVAPGHARLRIPGDGPLGRWTVTQVVVLDYPGNERVYVPDGTGTTLDGSTDAGPAFPGLGFDVVAGAVRLQGPGYPPCFLDSPGVVLLPTSSTPVRTGTSVVLSGRTAWGAGPRVAVLAESGAGRRLVTVVDATAQGTVDVPVVVPETTTFRLWALPDGSPPGRDVLLSEAVTVRAGLASAVTARDTSIRVPRGAKRTLSAYVSPKRAGVTVTLWRKKGGVWRVVTTKRSGSAGTVSYRVSRPARTSYYRWSTAYAGGYLPATSRIVRVTR